MASSQYDPNARNWRDDIAIGIRIVRDGLKEVPDFHLREFGEQLSQTDMVRPLKVKFLNSDLRDGDGYDAGGPRRDYMDDLWDGILGGYSDFLQFTKRAGQDEAMPKASGPIGPDGIPRAIVQEQPLLMHMGTIMMYSYLSGENLPIGRRFEEGVFKALFSLTSEEVDALNLPFPVQLKMMRAILECREIQIDRNHPLTHLERWGRARDNAEFVVMAEGIPDGGDFDPLDPAHQQAVIDALKGYLYGECGPALAPIHHMAKGAKQFRENTGGVWGGIQWKPFNDKVQGSLNRQLIVRGIFTRGGVPEGVRRKAQWLKEWILDPQTPDSQVKEFIKFATGSSALGNGVRIEITEQQEPYLPVPRAHSCFNQIDISPVDATYGRHHDRTKEAFIESLVDLANFNYHMG